MSFSDEFVRIVSSLADGSVPHVHAGRTRHGVDCAGVVAVALMEMGVDFEDVQTYRSLARNGSLVGAFDRNFDRCAEMEYGSPVLLWWDRKTREPQHVAVYVGDGMIVHSYARVGRVVKSHLGLWSQRVTHSYRFRESMVGQWRH